MFKVGDKVVATYLEGAVEGLRLDKVYTITSVSNYWKALCLKELKGMHSPKRFKLVYTLRKRKKRK